MTTKLPISAKKEQSIVIDPYAYDTNRDEMWRLKNFIKFKGNEVSKVIKTLKFNWDEAECYSWMSGSADEKTYNTAKIEIDNNESDDVVTVEFIGPEQQASYNTSFYDDQVLKSVIWFLSLKCLDPKIILDNEKLIRKMFNEFKKRNKIKVSIEIE